MALSDFEHIAEQLYRSYGTMELAVAAALPILEGVFSDGLSAGTNRRVWAIVRSKDKWEDDVNVSNAFAYAFVESGRYEAFMKLLREELDKQGKQHVRRTAEIVPAQTHGRFLVQLREPVLLVFTMYGENRAKAIAQAHNSGVINLDTGEPTRSGGSNE